MQVWPSPAASLKARERNSSGPGAFSGEDTLLGTTLISESKAPGKGKETPTEFPRQEPWEGAGAYDRPREEGTGELVKNV